MITDLNERSVRIQMKDQIDRMKRKKLTDVYDMSGSDEEGGSLDPPTVRKNGQYPSICCDCVCDDPLPCKSTNASKNVAASQKGGGGFPHICSLEQDC